MSKPFSLQPLLTLAQQKNESATRQLGQLNQQKQVAQDKLDTLLQYRKDYHARFQEAAQNGMDPAGLRNFQGFINRLDDAISQQRFAIEKANHSVQAGRTELNQAQRKMKSFETLAQRHVETAKKLETKTEQRLQDEHTGRFAAYKHLKNNEV
ncbi:MAG: flagellar export protein FliJ [Sideroxydans sp.]|nr:flagellar export protein FliJ [Sideroxydans sp.]